MKFKEVSIDEFIDAIDKLPPHDIRDGWIWWLRNYNTPGPYDRLPNKNHTAKHVYNHMTHPAMLIWLIEAAGVEKRLVKRAKVESNKSDNKKTQCGKIRGQVPWAVLEHALRRSA